jgi:hypothetical protein
MTVGATCGLTEIPERSMGVFSANTRNQFRNLLAGRRSDNLASSETRHSDGEVVSENAIGLTIPEAGFRPVSEFGGKMMEALFTEAGGGMGGGGDLELEADDRRQGGEGTRDWGTNYGAASAVAGLDVRTLATRTVRASGSRAESSAPTGCSMRIMPAAGRNCFRAAMPRAMVPVSKRVSPMSPMRTGWPTSAMANSFPICAAMVCCLT